VARFGRIAVDPMSLLALEKNIPTVKQADSTQPPPPEPFDSAQGRLRERPALPSRDSVGAK
jgi:hypothetical protein